MRPLCLLPLAALLVPLAGCGEGSADDGINSAVVEQTQKPLSDAAKRAGGDWAKLTPDEQKLFLDRARGNEAAARQMAGFMGGAGPGGPPKHP